MIDGGQWPEGVTDIVTGTRAKPFVKFDREMLEWLASGVLTGRQMQVVMAIARHTWGAYKEACELTTSDLSTATGIDARSINRVLSDLVDLRVIDRQISGPQRSLSINLEAPTMVDTTMAKKTRVRVVKKTRVTLAKKTRVDDETPYKDLEIKKIDPPIVPQTENLEFELDGDPIDDVDPAVEILEFLNQTAGRRFRPVESQLKDIRARLREGADMSDCRAVVLKQVARWGKAPQRVGDKDMRPYLCPTVLFRASKFWGYLEAPPP